MKPILFNKKLQEACFLPPPKRGRKDVSLMRHLYSGSDACKRHAKSLKMGSNSEYIGFAIILCKSIREEESVVLENGELLSITIISSPLPNIPFHADLLYSMPYDEDDEPKTLMRRIARNLLQKAIFLEDKNRESPFWTGEAVCKEMFK